MGRKRPIIQCQATWYNRPMVATDQSLSELVEALPPELQESVRAFVEFLLARRLPTANFSDDTEAHDPFPIDPRRSLMLREVETYHQLHPELVGTKGNM